MHRLTEESIAFWQLPRSSNAAWTQHYWDSAGQPWRDVLIRALRPVAPFTSVCDVGCHSGPNYRRLRAAFGDAFRYVGIDVNAAALAAAVAQTRTHRLPGRAQWCLESILDPRMDAWDPQSFDLVVSSSCLTHLAPADVRRALDAMQRLSARVVAIQEPAVARHDQIFHQWAHDYRALVSGGDPAWTWHDAGDVLLGVRT